MAKPSDFIKKQPSKNEQIIYELAHAVDHLDHRLWSVTSQLLSMGVMLNIDPEKMAKLLTTEGNELKEYADKINQAIQKIEKERAPKEGEGQQGHSHEGHDHDHGHDHGDGSHQ